MIGDCWPWALSDGTIVRGQAAESGLPPAIQWGDEPPIPLPTHPLYVVAYSGLAVFQGADNQAYAVTRTLLGGPIVKGPTFGTNGAWVSHVAELNVINGTHYERNGVLVPIPFPTSQGIASVTPAGDITWMDETLRQPWRTLGGVPVVRWHEDGDWVCGQAWNPDRVLAYHVPSEILYVAINAGTAVAPHICHQLDGSAIVTCFPGYVVASQDFTLHSDAEAPPIPVPSHARVMWRGMTSPLAGDPGNCLQGDRQAGDTRPIIDHAPDYPADFDFSRAQTWRSTDGNDHVYDPTLVLGWYWESHRPDRLAATLRAARATGAPVCVYDDSGGYQPETYLELQRLRREEGVTAVPWGQGYLLGESPDVAIARIAAWVRFLEMQSETEILLWRGLYTGSGAWSIADVERLQVLLDDLIERSPSIVADIAFARRQAPGGGGVDDHPRLLDYYVRRCAGTPVAMPPRFGLTPPEVPMNTEVTIDHFDSTTAPDVPARAVGRITGAGVEFLRWEFRAVGDAVWQVSATNRAPDLDHGYVFQAAGDYEIALQALDGEQRPLRRSDGALVRTGARRIITVVGVPPAESGADALINEIAAALATVDQKLEQLRLLVGA